MSELTVAVQKRAAGGGPHCGDACLCTSRDDRICLCTVDGLGHGAEAELAAHTAIRFVEDSNETDLLTLFKGCDLALRRTRGAVMGIAMIDRKSDRLCYAGVGNTRAILLGASSVRLMSYPGIVGAGYRRLRTEVHPIADGSLVIMYTDGLPENVDLTRYPDKRTQDVGALAETIMNDWYRGTDDGAVMVFRYGG